MKRLKNLNRNSVLLIAVGFSFNPYEENVGIEVDVALMDLINNLDFLLIMYFFCTTLHVIM